MLGALTTNRSLEELYCVSTPCDDVIITWLIDDHIDDVIISVHDVII